MALRFNTGFFTDIEQNSWFRDPRIIVKADAIDYNEIITNADLYMAGKNRPMIYEDSSGNKRYIEFTPYVHPTGAADLTIATEVTNADGTVTVTTAMQGFLVAEAGDLITSGEEAKDVAGLLPPDLFLSYDDNLRQREHYRVLVIEEGDFLWLMRRGDVELAYTGTAPSAGDNIMASTTVDGKVEESTAINTGGSVADYNTSLLPNLTGDAAPKHGACLAIATEDGSGGYVRVDLRLPPRYSK